PRVLLSFPTRRSSDLAGAFIMTILIDAGNTRIKLDWLNADAQQRASRVLAFTGEDTEAVCRWLSELPARPSAAVGVNVAGPATRSEEHTSELQSRENL